MKQRAGKALLLLLFACSLAWQMGRVNLHNGDPPAFVVEKGAGLCVWLGNGFSRQGVRQFHDGCRLGDVIALTVYSFERISVTEKELQQAVIAGEIVAIEPDGQGRLGIRRSMMTAAQRMALGVALHPDRMSRDDWMDLPGIGPALADRIETNRQNNGEFGSLEALVRVKGIGPAKIKAWKEFF